MKLEDQVCSLELARKLKELGVKQESEFYWGEGKVAGGRLKYVKELFTARDSNQWFALDHYAAFTVAEFGEMLPPNNRPGFWINYQKQKDGWFVSCLGEHEHHFGCATEADARAKMLCHLIEKGIIDAEIKQQKGKP